MCVSLNLFPGSGGGGGGKGRGGGGERVANRSRSATPAAEPQTEAGRSCGQREIAARDERAGSVAERAWSKGGQGRPAAREAGAESALVTATMVRATIACRTSRDEDATRP